MKHFKFLDLHRKLKGKCLCGVNFACELCVFSILHVRFMCLSMFTWVNVFEFLLFICLSRVHVLSAMECFLEHGSMC